MIPARDGRSRAGATLRAACALALACLAAGPASGQAAGAANQAASPPGPAAGREETAPVPLPSRITEVVAYGGTARVRRTASVPGSGLYVIAGLPGALDPDGVRVRLGEGSVASVEVAGRVQPATPDARVQELRERLAGLLREQRELTDRRTLLSATRDHLLRLFGAEEQAHEREVSEGRPNEGAWSKNLAWVTEHLAEAYAALREVALLAEALQTRIDDAKQELGGLPQGSVQLHDVVVDVVAAGATPLELDYLVHSAGWTPSYELRASADARSVELVYRAKVRQHTGEDWNGVALLLSTAQPERGAQGPEPQPIRLDVWEPVPAAGPPAAKRSVLSRESAVPADAAMDHELATLGDLGASVESHGLSVQFKLPRPETIASRDRPTDVLVGRETLEVSPERVVVPALDRTVWLRGRARNTSPWTLLPGPVAVHFGADFLGQAHFAEPVLAEQELTLHLGADRAVTCERVKTEDLEQQPGFLSKRLTRSEAWRITLENHGATAATQPDGGVAVLVREAIPLPVDDRIQVEVVSQSHEPSRDERWKPDREALGIRTWEIVVPRGAQTVLGYALRTTWPEGTTVVPQPVPYPMPR